MAVLRRGFIRVIGGGVVGAALVGGGLQGCDRMPDSAVAPWAGPGSETDPRRRALAWALLAPNPHNMQPWLVDLRREGEILLHIDRTRLLPETDPFARQIVIGHGTFLELLVLAAGADGYGCSIDYFPQGVPAEGEVDERPLARIRLQRDSAAKDPLFAQIPHRRSTKEPYREQPLQPDHAHALQAAHRAGLAHLTIAASDAAPAASLRGITERAMLIELQTPRTLKESIDRLRVGADAIAAQPDGIELHGPFFWWLSKLGLMTPEKAMTPGTMAYQGGIDYALGWARATPAFGWLTTAANDRVSQIDAGRAYVRLNLKATELGVAMHPVSQVLQEYPEMAELQREFLGVVGATSGQTVQMLFRLGYSEPVPPSPRRRLDALLMS